MSYLSCKLVFVPSLQCPRHRAWHLSLEVVICHKPVILFVTSIWFNICPLRNKISIGIRAGTLFCLGELHGRYILFKIENFNEGGSIYQLNICHGEKNPPMILNDHEYWDVQVECNSEENLNKRSSKNVLINVKNIHQKEKMVKDKIKMTPIGGKGSNV